MSMGRILVYVTIISVALVFLYNYLSKNGGGYTRVPQEVQVRYVPSDFNPTIDEENALAVLSNPYRYNREFNDLIYNFNLSLLYHVANRMNLPDSLKSQVRVEYEKHHPYIRRLYFNDFVQLKDTSSVLYEQWYNNESTNAVTLLKEVASKYTCFLVNHVLTSLIKTDEGRIYVSGRDVDTPCGVAMVEALQPMIARMEQRAAIADFSRSKGFLEERIERVTAELATMEVRDKKGLNKQLQTKLFGMNISSTEVEVSAISVLKVGFDLQKYFDLRLDTKSNTVVVTLPEPQILSHEVYPKVDKLEIGWLRELENSDLNSNFNLLRKEFRREALESDIFDKAKNQATELMETLIGPFLVALKRDFKLQVRFKNVNPDSGFDFKDDLEN
ncbi:MAG: DUF4230 domain-containing protein [Phaeodactylibacter sp.]|nr:DUF4230 domain-containing protein [Phaeodactylibacter sp.]